MGRALWLKSLKESIKLTVVLQGLGAEGRLNIEQWEHKLLLEGTISNNNGDDRENVTCTYKVNLRFFNSLSLNFRRLLRVVFYSLSN